jgi:hypothetical protein
MGLAAEIAARSLEGKRRFEIRLDPPELGRIDVRLDVDKHGQVTSLLISSAPRHSIFCAAMRPRLSARCSPPGFRTDDTGVQFSLRDQPGQQWSAPEPAGRPNRTAWPAAPRGSAIFSQSNLALRQILSRRPYPHGRVCLRLCP